MTLLKIAAAAVAGFLVTVVALVAYWAAFDAGECSGSECALEFAAIVTWSITTGILVSAVCGFAVYALTRRPPTQ